MLRFILLALLAVPVYGFSQSNFSIGASGGYCDLHLKSEETRFPNDILLKPMYGVGYFAGLDVSYRKPDREIGVMLGAAVQSVDLKYYYTSKTERRIQIENIKYYQLSPSLVYVPVSESRLSLRASIGANLNIPGQSGYNTYASANASISVGYGSFLVYYSYQYGFGNIFSAPEAPAPHFQGTARIFNVGLLISVNP